MVSLRDGKSYGSASAGTTATTASRRRASSAVADNATKPAASRRTARSAPAAAAVTVPAQEDTAAPAVIKSPQAPKPVSTPAKRGRPSRGPAGGLPSTLNKDLDVAAASLAPLPDEAEEGAGGSPSPVPRKKKLKVQPNSSKRPGAGGAASPRSRSRWAWLLVLVALGLAAAAAAAGSVVVCGRPHPVELQPLCSHVQPAWHRLTQEQLPAARTHLEVAAAQARLQGRQVYWQLVRHATDLKTQAQEHAHALQDQLQRGQLAALLQGLLPLQQQQQQPRHVFDTTPLPRLLPDSPAWQEVALDIREALTAPRRPKALTLLLACGSAADCGALVQALAGVQPMQGCLLVTSGYAPEEPAGSLQARLASFLSGCPQGVVILTQAEQLSRGWWSVLVNALSEQGGFQHNGHVDASQALFVFLQQLPPEEVAGAADHPRVEAVSSTLKQKLIDDLAEASGEDETVREVLEPLRRRIDFAAPARILAPQASMEVSA